MSAARLYSGLGLRGLGEDPMLTRPAWSNDLHHLEYILVESDMQTGLGGAPFQ